MKKLLFLFIFIFIIAAMLPSCTKTENDTELTANELIDAISLKMASYNSFEADVTTMMVFFDGEEEAARSFATGKSIVIDIPGGEFYTYDYMTMETTYQNSDYTERSYMLEAYCDGAYFLMNEEEAGVRRIYSQMTADDAKALIYEKNFDNEIIFNGQKAEYVKNSDGSYVVTVSELSESDVAKLNENFGTATASGQGRIKDVVTTINADIRYNIQSIKVEMIFEEDDAFNVEMSYFIEYTKLGTAKKDTTRLDKSKYTEVPDIRVLYEIEDMLLDRLEEEVVNCDYSATAEVTVNGMMETAREEDSITYRNAKNGFTYNLKGKVNGQRYEVSYANGIQSNYNSRGALVAKDSVSESVAKQYIYDYVINSAGYSSETVTDFSVRDLAGTKMYIIDCYVRDIGSLAQGFEALGGECERATLRITMYVSDGKITKTEALMAAFGEVSLGYNSTYDVRMVHKSELVYND